MADECFVLAEEVGANGGAMTWRLNDKRSGRGLAKLLCARAVACAVAVGLAGCSGRQSGLDPAGRGAEQIADLFWWMVAGSVVVWLAVVWLTYSAIRGRASKH